MLGLHDDHAIGLGMASIHPIVGADGERLETHTKLGTHEVPAQIFELVRRKIREIILHVARMSCSNGIRQGLEPMTSECRRVTNNSCDDIARNITRSVY